MNWFKRLCKIWSVIHAVPASFASQLVMAGVDLNVVRELMGHKDITMTLRYAHLAPSHKHRVVEALEASIDTLALGASGRGFKSLLPD